MRVFAILAVLFVFALLIAGCSRTATNAGNSVSQPPAAPRQVAQVEQAKYEHGPADAKVQLVAFYPLDAKHMKTKDFLNSVADKYPGKVKITVWDFRTEEGGDACRQVFGKICGGMQVNGQSEFKVMLDGKEKEVDITNGEYVNWTKPEVEAVIAQEVQKAYPNESSAVPK
jgi:hypothetical protein